MKKLNNKGFSLVELIIVIAIMVILVAVLAPQFTKWVERSRVSTDIQTASEIATAAQVEFTSNPSFATSGVANTTTLPSLPTTPTTKSTKVGTAGSSFYYSVDSNGAVTVRIGSATGTIIYPEPDSTAYGPYIN